MKGVVFISDSEKKSVKRRPQKKVHKKLSKKAKIIIISVASAVAVLSGGLFTFAKLWQTGTLTMPGFVSSTGFLQHGAFRYMDGVTVNGVDVSGLSFSAAQKKLSATEESLKIKFSIDVTAGEKNAMLTEKDFVCSFSTEEILEEAKQYCIGIMKGETPKIPKDFTIGAHIKDEDILTTIARISPDLEVEPENAVMTGTKDGVILCTDGVIGKKVDAPDLAEQIKVALKKGESNIKIVAKMDEIKPEVTAEDIRKNVVELSSFSTVSTNNANGNANMKLAFEKCNGSVIKPGEVWSFNKCTGNSNLLSAGWKTATVISGGAFVDGVGGGICQASTTIYNAVLRAGLGIKERHYHLWASGYVNEGFDATIDYPGLDLKFVNDTEHDIFLECTMSGTKLNVHVYGYPQTWYDDIELNGNSYDYVANDHYCVNTTRTFKLGGQVVKKETLPYSKYSLKPRKYGSSSTSASTEPGEESSEEPSESSTPSGEETSSETPEEAASGSD